MDRRLVAHVVLMPDGQDRATVLAELRDVLRRELPGYMVPSKITVLDALPLTSAGKVDLRAIEQATPNHGPRSTVIPPATALERVIAAVYGEVLGVSPISVEDDFFNDLGGHSLIATQAVARLRELLRFELPLRSIFETPTVRGLAAAINVDRTRGTDLERRAAIVVGVLEMSNDEVQKQLASTAVQEGEDPPCA
jgi:acyl carrier protein